MKQQHLRFLSLSVVALGIPVAAFAPGCGSESSGGVVSETPDAAFDAGSPDVQVAPDADTTADATATDASAPTDAADATVTDATDASVVSDASDASFLDAADASDATDATATDAADANVTDAFDSGIPANALTALQIVATHEANVVLRPDRTVWAWGNWHRSDGTFNTTVPVGQEAFRPMQMYPSTLTNAYAVAGWYDGYWALLGTPGTVGSRVVHWGRGRSGSDGRGTDGAGSVTGSVPQFRDNFAAPVEVLERVGASATPVDRVCAIAAAAGLALLRAIDDAGTTTDCNAGSAKTVWIVGDHNPYPNTKGVAVKLPGLPQSGSGGYSPPARIFMGPTSSGSPGLAIALEDGRAFALGTNPYNGFGAATPAPANLGTGAGAGALRSEWGTVKDFGMSFYYSAFIVRNDGSVWTSGYDQSGEMGLGAALTATTNGPVAVFAETCTTTGCADRLTGVTSIVSNDNWTTLALKGGHIYGWGNRQNGLLGAVQVQPQLFPAEVVAPVSGFTAVASGGRHALAIGPSNTVYSWGSGLRGALGDGVDGNTRTAPALVLVP